MKIAPFTKTYDGVRVLDFPGMELCPGKIYAVIGANGSGKSTFAKILAGVLRADKTGRLCDAASVGYMPQKNYAFRMSTVKNILLCGNDENRARELMESLGLSEHAKKRPTELSGGQQQRVAIARTLVLKPEIILFDEPMSALDVATRLALRSEIKKIQRDFSTTMIYITHDQEEAFAMSDRIIVMEEANIVQLDTPENIINSPANKYVEDFVINNLKTKIESLRKYTE